MESRENSIVNRFVTVLVRIALGTTFIYASLDKIANPSAFAAVVANYQIVPQWLVPVTAICLPWIEAVCGVALVVGRLERGAAMLLSLLLVVFIGVTLYNGYRGLDIACGCFTLAAKKPSNIALLTARNAILLIAGIWVMRNAKRWQALPAGQKNIEAGE